jgi:hypothetical protein
MYYLLCFCSFGFVFVLFASTAFIALWILRRMAEVTLGILDGTLISGLRMPAKDMDFNLDHLKRAGQ